MTDPATVAPPPLEETRQRIGLNRPQFLRLLDPAGRDGARVIESADPPTYLRERARAIEHAHSLFMADVRARLTAEFDNPETTIIIDGIPTPLISARQVARATGLGEFALGALKHRGAIRTHRVRNRALYALTDLYQAIDPTARHRHGAYQSMLASVFVDYYQASA